MPLLEVNDLSVYLKSSSGPINVINGVSFGIEKGMVFGLAGESGCGKSLTALAIMGILAQNMHAEGNVGYKGRNLLKEKPAYLRSIRGREISMIFQEPMTSLNPVLKVGYQITEVLTTHLKMSKSEAWNMTIGLMRAVKIPSPEVRAREYPHQMSGGMRQRIMMAMAVSCGPQLIIADEPTTALDVTIQAQILELLRGLKEDKGMSLLLITHDLGVIAENADKVAIMYAGRLVEVSGVGELFKRPRHPYTIGLLNSLPHGRGIRLKPIPGAVPKPGHLPEGCKFSDRCELAIPACKKEEPALRIIEGDGDDSTPHFARCIRSEDIS